MRCPDCSIGELVDYGNMMECPRCRFSTYFGSPRAKFRAEPDYGFDF